MESKSFLKVFKGVTMVFKDHSSDSKFGVTVEITVDDNDVGDVAVVAVGGVILILTLTLQEEVMPGSYGPGIWEMEVTVPSRPVSSLSSRKAAVSMLSSESMRPKAMNV
jgi:hypothetical protein